MEVDNLVEKYKKPLLERKLLAAVQQKPDLLDEIALILTDGAMTDHIQEWDILCKTIRSGQAPTKSVDCRPAEDPVETARKLTQLQEQRAFAAVLENSLRKLELDQPMDELILQLTQDVLELQTSSSKDKPARMIPVPEVMRDVITQLRIKHKILQETGATMTGIPTGFPALDELIGGIQPGLHLLAAEPGMGKTTLLLLIAAHAAAQGIPVLVVTFEEAPDRLALKVICQRARLEMKYYVDGIGDPDEVVAAVTTHAPDLAYLYLLEGSGKLTVPDVKARAQEAMKAAGANRCLVAIDYVQRWAASQRSGDEYRHVVANLVAQLRELSLRLDSPVLAISSQNRPGQGGAKLTSLKESGDLEYSADTAMFLVKSECPPIEPEQRGVTLSLQKNRYGDIGTIELVFYPSIGLLVEADQ